MSENKKPRIAEILGVEVGERFSLMGFLPHYVKFWIKSDGTFETEPPRIPNSSVALLRAIEQPCFVIRKPRWTEQDVEDAKAIRRILPEARDIDRVTETMTIVRDMDGFCLLTLQKDMFPNVKEGQTVKLADIAGGTNENQT